MADEIKVMCRDNMTVDQELEFVNKYFDVYEKEGFSKVFISPYEIGEDDIRQGKPFTVIGRVSPSPDSIIGSSNPTVEEDTEYTAHLSTLPIWIVQFEDGFITEGYPEEIIPSEIKASLWRDNDRKYLSMV